MQKHAAESVHIVTSDPERKEAGFMAAQLPSETTAREGLNDSSGNLQTHMCRIKYKIQQKP